MITHKDSIRHPAMDRIDWICSTISCSGRRDLILVLGAGSYGHPLVAMGEDLILTHESVLELAQLFAAKLRAYGIKAGVISPFDGLNLTAGKLHGNAHLVAARFLEAGCIPILHGDSIWSESGLKVISGDRICSYLATKLNPSRVGFGTDVDGIYLEGMLIPQIGWRELRAKLTKIGSSAAIDVTWGMKGKVHEAIKIASRGIPCCIFNLNRDLKNFLEGGWPGTLIKPSSSV